MNDPEFRQLMKKFFIAATIILVFMILLFFFFLNKVVVKEDKIYTSINKNKTIVIYITDSNCSKCNILSKELKRNNVDYKELNKGNKYYNSIIRKLGISDSNIYTPTLMYVKKGKLYSYIVDIKTKKELNKFIKKYKLTK